MKKLVYILVTVLLVLTACTGTSRHPQLVAADSLLLTQPDSALTLLRSMSFSSTADRMYHFLLLADACNKCYDTLPPDSILREVADFYDRHGSANEQVRAHYLLGCAYRDMGEAPQALQCYQDAVDLADTISDKNDYRLLCRVYSQMAYIFYRQGLYHKHLELMKTSVNYAWRGNDTLAAVLNYENLVHSYRELDMPDSMLIVSENAYRLYTQYGYNKYAASALSNNFRILIKNREWEKVKKLMSYYELESGFFDSSGNIEHGREIYYNVKGYYHLGKGEFDTAEYFFRKELHDGKDFNNQNAGAYGLAELFHILHQPDSAAKYYQYAYAMNDSMYAQKTTEEVARMQAMYDYSRHQKMIRDVEKKVEHERSIWQWGGVLFLFILLIIAFVIKNIRNEKKTALLKYEHSKEIVRRIKEDIERAKKEIVVLKTTQDSAVIELLEEKEKQIAILSEELKQALGNKLKVSVENQLSNKEEKLKLDKTYKTIILDIYKGKELTKENWEQLTGLLHYYFPECSNFIMSKRYMLSDEEYRVCILIRLHVMPKSIGMIIKKSDGSVTNIRIRLLKKLFGEEGKAKDFDKKLTFIC